MMKSSNIFQGQKQPKKGDARSQSPQPTHDLRRRHLNHELVPRRGKPEPHRQLSDDPVQPSLGRTFPGTSPAKASCCTAICWGCCGYQPGYHRALESRRQALCVSLHRASAGRLLHCQREKAAGLFPHWNAAVCWSRCQGSQTGRRRCYSIYGPRNPTSCNHPSENPA